MEVNAFRKIITNSPYFEWYNDLTVEFKFPLLKEPFQVKSMVNIYKFVSEEVEMWSTVKKEIPSELNGSLSYFLSLKEYIIESVNRFSGRSDFVQSNFNQEARYFQDKINSSSSIKPLHFNNPLTQFLFGLYKDNYDLFRGAYKYFTDDISSGNLSRKVLTGILLAYEFDNDHNTDFVKRKTYEKKSLETLRKSFTSLLNKSEENLTNHLKNYNDVYKTKLNELQTFKDDKEAMVGDWFKNSSSQFETFFINASNKIADLEKTYQEKLRLEKPAEYWRLRAEKLNKQAWLYFKGILIIIGLFGVSIYILLLVAPHGMLVAFKETSATIKWTIFSVIFISIIFYAIRLVLKVVFSTFHLARDAEEREQLTYVYLALLEDASVDIEEKKLVLQALFSRADTGLLKEDSSPTMPNDFLGKILNR